MRVRVRVRFRVRVRVRARARAAARAWVRGLGAARPLHGLVEHGSVAPR